MFKPPFDLHEIGGEARAFWRDSPECVGFCFGLQVEVVLADDLFGVSGL